jgi:hypothetical protein
MENEREIRAGIAKVCRDQHEVSTQPCFGCPFSTHQLPAVCAVAEDGDCPMYWSGPRFQWAEVSAAQKLCEFFPKSCIIERDSIGNYLRCSASLSRGIIRFESNMFPSVLRGQKITIGEISEYEEKEEEED